MSQTPQRGTARTRRARCAHWTGTLDGFPQEWLDRLSIEDDGILCVQTARGRIRTSLGGYVLQGQRGIYPAPKGVAEYNYDLSEYGWAARRRTEIEFVEWAGRFEDLPASWRARGNFEMELGVLVVQALEGKLPATIGDRIIQGPFSEFYPSSADTFKRNYQVNETAAA